MKTAYRFALIASSLSVLFAASSASAAQNFTPEFEDKLVSVCRATVDNDAKGLRRAVTNVAWAKNMRSATYRALADGLVCNGMTVMSFAKKYGATDTFNQFAKYSPSDARTVIEIQDIAAAGDELTDITVAFTDAR